MEPIDFVIQFLIVAFLSGVLATASMVLFMTLITKFGWAQADMMRAIGSLFTKSVDSSLLVGGFIHFTAGVGFAILYSLFLQQAGGTGLPLALVGAALGFGHGLVVSLILASMVAEHHPLKQFREAGKGVVASYFAGHVVYGLVVGICVATSGLDIPSSKEYVATLKGRTTYVKSSEKIAEMRAALRPMIEEE